MSEQRWAIYGEAKVPISEGDTIAQVKEALSRHYPDLRNAEGYTDEEGNIRFRITAGTKG